MLYGIKSWYDFPEIEFVYHELNPETLVEVVNVLNKAGMEVDNMVIEETMGVELKKDEEGNVVKHEVISNMGDDNMNDNSGYKGDGKQDY